MTEHDSPLPHSINYQHMLDTMLRPDESPLFSCTYVKASGEVATLSDARAIRFEGERRSHVLVRVGGGVRRLRTASIVVYNGEEVYLW